MRSWVLAIGIVLIAGSAYAQTTGFLQGTVTDSEEMALPGVSVTIESPKMQGSRATVTDVNGLFRFPAVPPGEYTVTANLSGFGTVRQEDVDVDLGRTVTLNITMQSAAFEEVLEVTGEAPLVDVTATELGVNFDAEQLTSMPLGRNFTAVTNTLGGAQEDETGYAMYGSTGAENSYIIDGIDTTEVERGRQGTSVNMEFVEEIQVKAGGYNAEFGRSTGGLINVITKSGGNDFHGDVFGYYHSDSTQSDFDPVDYDTIVNPPTFSTGILRQDYGFDLGGYIVRDKLWFFAAYNRVDREDEELTSQILQDLYDAPELAKTDREEDQYAAKLTWNVSGNHSLVASYFADPEDWLGANNAVVRGPESTWLNTRTTGGDNYTIKYMGLPSQTILLNASWAYHEEEDTILPAAPGGDAIQYQDRRAVDEFRTGGLGYNRIQDFQRESWDADLTWYLQGAGSHELKVGYGQQALEANKTVRYTGGQQVWILGCTSSYDQSLCLEDPVLGLYAYMHEAYLTGDSSIANWEIAEGGYTENPTTDNVAAFVQDSWRVLPNLTLNLGVRWESQALANRNREWIKLDDNWAPRFGFVWDVQNDGRSKLYAHYGKFYENIPMDINIRFMGAEVSSVFYNTDPLDPTPNNDLRQGRVRGATSWLELFEALFGFAVDPDLKGQSIDEYILGYETNLFGDWTFGISGVFRDLNTVIEDGGAVIGEDYGYIVGNGGEGFLSRAPDLAYTGDFPVPKPKREYRQVQLTAQKRFSNNWSMYAAYTWSQLEGNYDGTYQRSTGQLDPNINSSYDYVDFMYVVDTDNPFTTELDGPLSNDRAHQFKVSGFYNFDFGFEIGATAYWQEGRPLSAQGWSDAYRNNELWLTQRGALGTMPAEYEMDLHFAYPLRLGDTMNLTFALDIFNVLNRQGVTDVDQLYDLSEGELVPNRAGCGSYVGMSYSPDIPFECAPNPDYQTPTSWQGPRFMRIGVKFSF
jgi:outer membrane receptor protein involved in Fe transport